MINDKLKNQTERVMAGALGLDFKMSTSHLSFSSFFASTLYCVKESELFACLRALLVCRDLFLCERISRRLISDRW